MMVQSNLGLGPWNVFHQGLADRTGLEIGPVISIVGVVIIVFALVPMREAIGIGTILNAVVIGPTVDLTRAVLAPPSSMLLRVLLMVAGPVVIAIGSGLYIGAGLGPGPRDGIMTGLARRGIPIARARTGIEVTVLLLGLWFGGTVGIGTLWFAAGIGPMVAFFLPRLSLPDPEPAVATTHAA